MIHEILSKVLDWVLPEVKGYFTIWNSSAWISLFLHLALYLFPGITEQHTCALDGGSQPRHQSATLGNAARFQAGSPGRPMALSTMGFILSTNYPQHIEYYQVSGTVLIHFLILFIPSNVFRS